MATKMSMGRIKGFDGVRGAASFLVVVHHTLISWTHLGDVFVYLFFELSGFLILSILANARVSIEQRGSTVGSELMHFWINRALRILPVYYITLAAIVLLASIFGGFLDLRQNVFWYASYTQNFLIAFITKSYGTFSHTWSLAVEQQFYFVFGIAFLLIPSRRQGLAFLVIGALCLMALYGLDRLGARPIATYVLPFEGFLFIIAGGAIALYRQKISEWFRFGKTTAEVLAWSLIASILVLSLLRRGDEGAVLWSAYLPIPIVWITVFLVALVAAFLWLLTAYPELSLVRIFESRVFLFLGSISYALYVVHYPLAIFFASVLGGLHLTTHALVLVRFALTAVTSIGLSTLSRNFVERPMSRLKSRRSSVFLAEPPSVLTEGAG